ncbi:MAG: PEP-CTERM sorting domain-containing protein [Phycisphaerae bacterium]
MRRFSCFIAGVAISVTSLHAAGGSFFASTVADYSQGVGANPSYLDATTALGTPERYTGEGIFPGPVSPVNPPFGTDEIVSLGTGGTLTVGFPSPISDDAENLFGVDLIVFSNSFFVYDGTVGGLFATGEFVVSVSSDGTAFTPLDATFSNGLFPTLGYQDIVDPFSAMPGNVPTDFTRPMNPSLTAADFAGLSFADLLDVYGESGGGIPIDIASSGLADVNYVRIEVTSGTIAIDAFAIVPEPATISSLLCIGVAGFMIRRRGRA